MSQAAVEAVLRRAFAGSNMEIKVSALRVRLKEMFGPEGPNSVRDILDFMEYWSEDEPYLTDKLLSVQSSESFELVDSAIGKVLAAHTCAVLEVARYAKQFSVSLGLMVTTPTYVDPTAREQLLNRIGVLFSINFRKACDLQGVGDLAVECYNCARF